MIADFLAILLAVTVGYLLMAFLSDVWHGRL